jgi:hypothetical protein
MSQSGKPSTAPQRLLSMRSRFTFHSSLTQFGLNAICPAGFADTESTNKVVSAIVELLRGSSTGTIV